MEDIKKKLFCSGHDCFKEDFFNTNLKNGTITHLSYKNLSVEQNPNIIYPFDKLIKILNPKRVIEVGTFAGGLTLLIRDLLDYNNLFESDVITYDVRTPNYLLNQIENVKIKSYTKNLFSEDYSNFRDDTTRGEIIDLIQRDGKTLVLCDGGSKKNEFRLLSDYLKKGDIIMAHDYSPNEKYFQENINNKIWNWLEIQDSDIEESCIKNNLVPFMDEDFKKVVWVCKIKE